MQQHRQLAIIVHPAFPLLVEAKRPKQGEPARWEHLPLDILHKMASHLPTARDLCNFERVSRACWVVSADDLLWRRLCYLRFNVPRSAPPSKCWKDIYKFNHDVLYGLVMRRRMGKMPHMRNGFIHLPMVAA